MTLLCKCMDMECKNIHFADLSEEKQNQLMQRVNNSLKDDAKEDKAWPPSNMETK